MAKSELIMVLEMIEREKGIRKDDVLKMIEGAVASSLRKHVGKNAVIEAIIDPETAEFKASVIKKVVDTVADQELEISLPEAKRFKKDAAVGEEVRLPAPAADFARIAAQTAKQVLTQKVREVERDKLYDEYKPKEGEIITGSVHRFMDRNIVVDIGKAEAILPAREQIRRERYAVGSNLKAVILRVERAANGPQVVLSRAHPLFLRRLMELEIPEVAEKIIEILEIARDPGIRAKVVVKSNDPKIDPIGSCVGLRGSRIRSVMAEIANERIDLIPFSADLPVFLANALAPAKVASVRVVDEATKRAQAIVSDEQLAVAVGKEGQNVRLAARVTGWELEVKSLGQKSAESQATRDKAVSALASLEGIGEKTAEILVKVGLTDIERLAQCRAEDLTTLQGIGEKTAAKIIAKAKEAVAKNKPASVETPAPAEEKAAG